ncbi:MAG: hypothetical protein JWM72_1490, partial [Actinomycetia bacterium]|nr:hypothetical protein [Actinomycetes bacterium]
MVRIIPTMHPRLPGITERRAEFDAASHRL